MTTSIEKRLITLCAMQTIALGIGTWIGFESCFIARKALQTNGEQTELIHLQEQKIELLEHKLGRATRVGASARTSEAP